MSCELSSCIHPFLCIYPSNFPPLSQSSSHHLHPPMPSSLLLVLVVVRLDTRARPQRRSVLARASHRARAASYIGTDCWATSTGVGGWGGGLGCWAATTVIAVVARVSIMTAVIAITTAVPVIGAVVASSTGVGEPTISTSSSGGGRRGGWDGLRFGLRTSRSWDLLGLPHAVRLRSTRWRSRRGVFRFTYTAEFWRRRDIRLKRRG